MQALLLSGLHFLFNGIFYLEYGIEQGNNKGTNRPFQI
jgi:hypothetical protein